MYKIIIHTDGGARGNPGSAGIGAVIESQFSISNLQFPIKISKYIGEATNNQAEYRAVIEALKWVEENRPPKNLTNTYEVKVDGSEDLEVECFLDSELIVEQLNQRYKIKHEGLKPLFWEVRDLVMQLGGKVTFKYIPREQNAKADKLVNEAIDKGAK